MTVARIKEMRPLMDDKKKAIIRLTADALAAFWPDIVSECVRASGDKLSALPREEVVPDQGGGGSRDRRP